MKKSWTIFDEHKVREKINFTPHPAQEAFLDCDARFKVLAAGVRFGKSAVAAYEAIKVLAQRDKEIMKAQRAGRERPKPAHVWIVAPSYGLAERVFSYVMRWYIQLFPSAAGGLTTKPYPRIKTAKGSFVECKSAENPQQLLGEELDLLIVDECSRVQKSAWEQYLFQRLASRQGKAIFISTPKGKNWFYDEWVRAKEWQGAFQYPSNANPAFPQEEFELAKKRLPEAVFRQEYLAVFHDEYTGVFRGVKEIIRDNILADQKAGSFYTMGVDLGKLNDFTVLTVLENETGNIVHIDRFKGVDWPLARQRIKQTSERYNNARVVIDSSGRGDPVYDELRNEGVMCDDFCFTGKSKGNLIQKLSIAIQDKWIRIPNYPQLVDELDVFGYDITERGNITYSAPKGMHDDCVCSLALAVWSLPEKPGKVGNALEKELARGFKRKRTSFV